jgi:hypothetical protein
VGAAGTNTIGWIAEAGGADLAGTGRSEEEPKRESGLRTADYFFNPGCCMWRLRAQVVP